MKNTWTAFTWIAVVGAAIGLSVGVTVSTILNALEQAGGGIHKAGGIGAFVGLSFALGFWTLAWALTDRE